MTRQLMRFHFGQLVRIDGQHLKPSLALFKCQRFPCCATVVLHVFFFFFCFSNMTELHSAKGFVLSPVVNATLLVIVCGFLCNFFVPQRSLLSTSCSSSASYVCRPPIRVTRFGQTCFRHFFSPPPRHSLLFLTARCKIF